MRTAAGPLNPWTRQMAEPRAVDLRKHLYQIEGRRNRFQRWQDRWFADKFGPTLFTPDRLEGVAQVLGNPAAMRGHPVWKIPDCHGMVEEPDMHTDHTAPLATMAQAKHGLGVVIESKFAGRTPPGDLPNQVFKSFTAKLLSCCRIADIACRSQ